MANKTWTATDLKMDRLAIAKHGTDLHIERRYSFLDDQGAVLSQIEGGRLVRVVPIASVPQNILDGLQAIDAWTKSEALDQEGMS